MTESDGQWRWKRRRKEGEEGGRREVPGGLSVIPLQLLRHVYRQVAIGAARSDVTKQELAEVYLGLQTLPQLENRKAQEAEHKKMEIAPTRNWLAGQYPLLFLAVLLRGVSFSLSKML